MGPGATHDPLRDRAYRIVMTAKERNLCFSNLRSAL